MNNNTKQMSKKSLNKVESKSSIFLAWAHSKTEPNFGDELGPYIIKKITGMKIVHIPVLNHRFHLFTLMMKRLVTFKLIELYYFTLLFFGKRYYIFLGSIIQFYKLNGGIVWGAGLIDRKFSTGKHKYYAVRGPKTRDLLIQRGYKVPEVFGDPALILPRIYDVPVQKRFKVGIIPHIVHYDGLIKNELHHEMTIVDLKTADIELVIDSIRSCEYIISSSLHGLIVAHAYNVPALWVNLSEVKLMGDNMKFYDYFESLHIPGYDAISIDHGNLTDLKSVMALFETYQQNCLASTKELENLIDKFIENAPPLIKKEYLFD